MNNKDLGEASGSKRRFASLSTRKAELDKQLSVEKLKLEQLKNHKLPEYLEKLDKLEKDLQERLLFNEAWRDHEVQLVKEEFKDNIKDVIEETLSDMETVVGIRGGRRSTRKTPMKFKSMLSNEDNKQSECQKLRRTTKNPLNKNEEPTAIKTSIFPSDPKKRRMRLYDYSSVNKNKPNPEGSTLIQNVDSFNMLLNDKEIKQDLQAIAAGTYLSVTKTESMDLTSSSIEKNEPNSEGSTSNQNVDILDDKEIVRDLQAITPPVTRKETDDSLFHGLPETIIESGNLLHIINWFCVGEKVFIWGRGFPELGVVITKIDEESVTFKNESFDMYIKVSISLIMQNVFFMRKNQ